MGGDGGVRRGAKGKSGREGEREGKRKGRKSVPGAGKQKNYDFTTDNNASFNLSFEFNLLVENFRYFRRNNISCHKISGASSRQSPNLSN